MRRRGALLLAALAACSPSTPRPAPPSAAEPSPPAASSSAYAPVPPPPPPPRFQVAAPFALVARADAATELRAVPLSSGVLALASSQESGVVRVAEITDEEVRLLPELSKNFPEVSPLGSNEPLGMLREGSSWWLQVRYFQDEPRTEFFRHIPGGWSRVDRIASGETGLTVSAEPWGDRLLIVSHGSAGVTPVFQIAGQERQDLPKFTETPRHAHGCKSHMTTVMAFRAWASGEVLALGTSCWIPVLQIERWAPRKQRSEAHEIAGITLQDPSTFTLVSPDEAILDTVTLHGFEDTLFRVRIVRKNGVWKIRDKTPVTFPDTRAIEAGTLLEKLDARLEESWTIRGEVYLAAAFPLQGPPLEHLLLRFAPVRKPLDF